MTRFERHAKANSVPDKGGGLDLLHGEGRCTSLCQFVEYFNHDPCKDRWSMKFKDNYFSLSELEDLKHILNYWLDESDEQAPV